MKPGRFTEEQIIGVLKQAFEEELGFATPQIYRRRVAEFAKLYQQGREAEIQTTVAGTNDEATTIINPLDEGALPARVLYPTVLPAPVPPGNQRVGNKGAVRDTPESVLGGGTPSLAPGPFTLPPGPTVPATGIIGVPPGPAEIPPSPPPTST